jgi:Replication-relaxation
MRTTVIQPRDAEIFKMVSRVGFLTERQICALYYPLHDGFTLDLEKARQPLSRRISYLVKDEYLIRSIIPGEGPRNRAAYLLGPAGATYMKSIRDMEDQMRPRWKQRKHNSLLIRSRHDVVTINFFVNIILLSRLLPDFYLVDWLSDRECRFYINGPGGKKEIVNPDLYLVTEDGSARNPRVFIEVDNGTLDNKQLHIKLIRFFRYYRSKKYLTDLESRQFPMIAILAPDERRLETLRKSVIKAKQCSSDAVSAMPFWLSTFDQVEANCVDKGYVSTKPLERVWRDEQGTERPSPLAPNLDLNRLQLQTIATRGKEGEISVQ